MPESADRTPTGDYDPAVGRTNPMTQPPPEWLDEPTGGLRERIARVIARRVPGCTTLFTGTLADAVLPVVEAETAALREQAQAKVAALMDEQDAATVDRIQAERDTMPADERTRLDAADAPMLRIQLAGMARKVAETKAELDRTSTAAAREIWVKAGFDTILHWKQRAEEAERKHAQALDQIADERRARLEAEAAARRVRQALARKTLLAGPRAEKAVRVADVEAALDAEQPSVCCDLHGLPCEPPSELCCRSCTEANHPQHPAGVRCVLDQPEETR